MRIAWLCVQYLRCSVPQAHRCPGHCRRRRRGCPWLSSPSWLSMAVVASVVGCGCHGCCDCPSITIEVFDIVIIVVIDRRRRCRTLVVGRRSSVVGRRSSVVGRRSSVVGRWSSVVGRRSPVVGRRSSVVGHQSSVVGHQSSVVGRRRRHRWLHRRRRWRRSSALASVVGVGVGRRLRRRRRRQRVADLIDCDLVVVALTLVAGLLRKSAVLVDDVVCVTC